MLTLAHPFVLLLLLLLPPLAWLMLRQRRLAVPHPSLALFVGLPVGRAGFARYGGLILRLLALALLIVALAGPRLPDLRTRLDTEGIALVILVDVSGSMAEKDFDYNGEFLSRLDAVKRVFRLFIEGTKSGQQLPGGSQHHLDGRPTDLIGLVCFATRPETTCPVTLSHQTLLRLLDQEQPRGVPGESETNLSDAMALGLARLRSAGPRRKVMVLLTDGEHNQAQTRSGWSPRQTAQVAAGLDIPIYTIDAGVSLSLIEEDPTLRTMAQSRRQAVETLQDIAEITKGKYFAAHDGTSLLKACREIDRLQRSTIGTHQYRRYYEGYPWAAFASFVLFLAALGLEQTLWRRLP